MQYTGLLRSAAAIPLFVSFAAAIAAESPEAVETIDDTIDEIVVTADFRGRDADEIGASMTLFDAELIEAAAVQHFEELINVVPNLNWSGDGHRARYFQIRGVGELEQYEGAPNPSVGFLIDDIDFSGIGAVATLFDVERIEVLRGPQGTRYGANALAGLVYVTSVMPKAQPGGRLKITGGSDGTRSGGLAFGGPLDDDSRLAYRLSAHHYRSDGFRRNTYLGRTDTNGRDETTLRGRLSWQPSPAWDVNAALMFTDIDNGYDAFAIDNSYTMLSDKPGDDAQQSLGGSLRVEWLGAESMSLTSITAAAESDLDFGFDADWGNDDAWAPVTYDYVSSFQRRRTTLSQEFRLSSTEAGRLFGGSTDWLVGVYALRLGDELSSRNVGEYFDPAAPEFADSLDTSITSDYTATSVAAFAQLDHALGGATTLSAGIRIERRNTDYEDSDGLAIGPSETMSGGELTLSHEHSDRLTSFVTLARGYKAGGFNLGVVPPEQRAFDAEALWNLEAGIRSRLAAGRVLLNASVFASRRDDQQVRTSLQLVPGDPASFVFLTDNAASGETLGFEADVRWFPHDAWELYANISLLDASFDEYLTPRRNENFETVLVDLSGREQAHAPSYTLAAGAAWRHPGGVFLRLDANARDAFFFDVSHDQQSDAYVLVNARLGYEADRWSVSVWSRNLFDEEYAVRGFFFENEPPDFPTRLYTRLGDPRQSGLSFEWRF